MARERREDENKNRGHNEQVTRRVRIFLRGKRWYANYRRNGKQMRPPLKTISKKQARLKGRPNQSRLPVGVLIPKTLCDSTLDGLRQSAGGTVHWQDGERTSFMESMDRILVLLESRAPLQ